MYKGLYNFLEHHNVLHSLQFGFRQNCLTKHELVSITKSIRQSIDNNRPLMGPLQVTTNLYYEIVLHPLYV